MCKCCACWPRTGSRDDRLPRSVPPPTMTTPFVRPLRIASSRLRKPVSTIPSVSVRALSGRSAPLIHRDGVAA